MAGLGHGEDTRNGHRHDARQVGVVVLLRAEVQHRRAEQTPLHARLDLQARVGGDEFLEAGDVSAVVVGAAQITWERPVHVPVVGQDQELAQHTLAVLGHGLALDALQRGLRRELPGAQTHVGPGAEQPTVQRLDVDSRGAVLAGDHDRTGVDAGNHGRRGGRIRGLGRRLGRGLGRRGGLLAIGALGSVNHHWSFVFARTRNFLTR